jgi:hypothetical protein
MREAGMEDDGYLERMDIWAEALKHSLLQFKANATQQSDLKSKVSATLEIEDIIGNRCKFFKMHVIYVIYRYRK